MIEHWYLANMILVTSPFNQHHTPWPLTYSKVKCVARQGTITLQICINSSFEKCLLLICLWPIFHTWVTILSKNGNLVGPLWGLSSHTVIYFCFCFTGLLPYEHHPMVGKLCIKYKRHMVTASYVSPAMRALHREWVLHSCSRTKLGIGRHCISGKCVQFLLS